MKKILATILATAMVFSMIACGNNEVTETTETVSTETTAVADATVGQLALDTFKTFAEANKEATAEEVANAIVPALEDYFGAVVMPVEEGFLNGFDNAEIKGFEEGAMFAPMVGSIAFVGYVFTLATDADADAFVTTLTNSANPRWNICVEADEMFTEVIDNKVFFVMSPSSFE